MKTCENIGHEMYDFGLNCKQPNNNFIESHLILACGDTGYKEVCFL